MKTRIYAAPAVKGFNHESIGVFSGGYYTDLRSQMAVAAYLSNKQLLLLALYTAVI